MKTMNLLILTALAAFVLAATTATAQDDRVRNASERVSDRHELRQDQRQKADDLRDLGKVRALITRYEQAEKNHDRSSLTRLDHQVSALLAGESREAGRETRQAKREVRRGRREKRSDRREIRENRREGAPTAARRDDRHDLRDDRRDLRDDRRDTAREAQRRDALAGIAGQWSALIADRNSTVDQRLELLRRVQGIAAAEYADDHREQREDRRELREDRRETREDRRQR